VDVQHGCSKSRVYRAVRESGDGMRDINTSNRCNDVKLEMQQTMSIKKEKIYLPRYGGVRPPRELAEG
jgi:hypothetical protein